MVELAEIYPKENKILDIYLKNASAGTVVVECNSQVVGMQICEYLHTNYFFELIDYANLHEGIVRFLEEVGQRANGESKLICIYHFPTDSDTVDVIKSLNISRELLRKIDRMVWIMPTFLVDQIKDHEPNLKDYIGLFLDYNRSPVLPFEPIFDVNFRKHFTKDEQKSLKKESLMLNKEEPLKEKLNQYFRYVNQFHNRKLSKHECFQTLIPAYKKILVEVHDYRWEKKEDYFQAIQDIMYQTAVILALQQYYLNAQDIFAMMLDMEKQREKGGNIQVLQALEGMSYCEYEDGNYLVAERYILMAVDILRNMDTQNEAWICRLYSNYAACQMKIHEYANAKACLMECLNILDENQLLTAERQMRIQTNLMICNMELKVNPNQYIMQWTQFMHEIAQIYGMNSINYANCLLLDSWYKGILMGMNTEAIWEAESALKINRDLLKENSYILAVNYDVLEKLYHQVENQECAQRACTKKKNILRNYQ